jgi:hypothetical protein
MSDVTPKEGEEVLLHLRKSIFTLGRQMLVFAIAVAASGVLLTFLYKYPAASIVAAVLLLLSLAYAFYYFIIWFYDVYAITNMRVIVLARKNMFHEEFAEISYLDILDVSYRVKGVAATVFQFGDVALEREGAEPILLHNVGTPGVVQETLKNLVDVTKKKRA